MSAEPNQIDFSDWFDDNLDSNIEIYLATSGADRGLLDDDLADLPNDGEFQEWCEKQFNDQMESANAD